MAIGFLNEEERVKFDNSMRTVTLNKVRQYYAGRISGSVLDSLQFETNLDFITDDFLYRFSWDFLADRREVKDRVTVPETWWDGFKKEFFPPWLLKKFPANMRTIETRVTEQKVCPHLDFPRHAKCVQFLITDRKE